MEDPVQTKENLGMCTVLNIENDHKRKKEYFMDNKKKWKIYFDI